jgi:hypothetical protein
MDRSRRLTDGKKWRTFMRLLRLDDLMTSYTKARPGTGLLVVDLESICSIVRTRPFNRIRTAAIRIGLRRGRAAHPVRIAILEFPA